MNMAEIQLKQEAINLILV